MWTKPVARGDLVTLDEHKFRNTARLASSRT
jgi:hypothetical protein